MSDIHILGYENSKLTHHFTNIHSKKVKCTPKIEKKSYGKTFTYTREKSYLIFKNLNLKENLINSIVTTKNLLTSSGLTLWISPENRKICVSQL